MKKTPDPTGKQPAKPKRYDISKTPDLTGQWKKLETFGYSLNGRGFLIPQGQSSPPAGAESGRSGAIQER